MVSFISLPLVRTVPKGDAPSAIRPRAFPLGLLAPRCFVYRCSSHCPPIGRTARAALCLGRGRNPLPSASSPRASLFYRRRRLLSKTRRILQSRTGLGQPEAHNPSPLRFREFSSVASATELLSVFEGQRSPLRHGRPSGNARGRRPCACPMRV